MKIDVYLRRGDLRFRSDLGEAQTHIHDMPEPAVLRQHFLGWLLCQSRSIFQALPVGSFDIGITKEVQENFKEDWRQYVGILGATNDEVSNNAKDSISGDGTLCINISDDMRYGSFYKRLQRNHENVHIINQQIGFDRETRKWTGSKPVMPLPDLIEFCRKHQIERILSINHYFADKYLEYTGVHLPTLFAHLGVDYIHLDNDPYDLRPNGHLLKAFHSGRRFCNLSILNEYWDGLYGNDCQYIAIPQDYQHIERQAVTGDYDIVVLTNSRLENVKANYYAIQLLSGKLDQRNIFQDFQLWYLAARKLVLERDILEIDKLTYNSWLHQFYYAFANYLKYRIIEGLRTKRSVKVYGDLGWKELCPGHYCGSLNNNEIERLYAEDNHLFLLLNFSFTYLDASGPVYDVVRRGVHWLNVPPIVSTFGTGPEYRTPAELNEKIEDVPLADPEILQCYIDSTNGLESGIYNGSGEKLLWDYHLNEHRKLLDDAVDGYLAENRDVVTNVFEAITGYRL